jgi:mono/diheme cytochrome c family protein
MKRFQTGLALALLTLGACNVAWSQNAPSGDVANGKRVYLAVGCFACHGRAGQGGAMVNAAPPLAQGQYSLEVFKVLVRAGRNDMPAYTESVLADKDVADVYAFLRSLPGRREAKDIPLLNQ